MPVFECNCGSIKFEVGSELYDIIFCHCSICRRFSGGNGIPVIIVNDTDFSWLSGQNNIKVWRKPDVDWDANFCATCGSAIPGKNDASSMYIPAGLIPDDAGNLKVKHHIFVGSKACWDEIGDAGHQYHGRFEHI